MAAVVALVRGRGSGEHMPLPLTAAVHDRRHCPTTTLLRSVESAAEHCVGADSVLEGGFGS